MKLSSSQSKSRPFTSWYTADFQARRSYSTVGTVSPARSFFDLGGARFLSPPKYVALTIVETLPSSQ